VRRVPGAGFFSFVEKNRKSTFDSYRHQKCNLTSQVLRPAGSFYACGSCARSGHFIIAATAPFSLNRILRVRATLPFYSSKEITIGSCPAHLACPDIPCVPFPFLPLSVQFYTAYTALSLPEHPSFSLMP